MATSQSQQPTVRVVHPGAPFVRSVGDAIRELQGGDALQLVRVVAPDGATVDGLRRCLPRYGGACGAEVGGTLQLARTLAAAELGDRRSAPTVAVLAAVQRVLSNAATRPAMFASCADHPATHDAIVRSINSLNGVFTLPGDHRGALNSLAGSRPSASAVCEVVSAVRAELLEAGFVDSAEVMRIATNGLSHPAHGNEAVGPLVIVVTQQFNPAHVSFLNALVARASRTIVIAASTRADDLSLADHVSSVVGFMADVAHHADVPGARVAVVSCPDHDEEVREVTRRIVALLEEGVIADRIAVFYPPSGPHRASLAAAFDAAGIAARGQVTPLLKGSVAGQVVQRIVALMLEGLERRTIIDLARIAPFGHQVDDEGITHSIGRPADQWNRLARRYGVVGERDWTAFGRLEFDDDDRDDRTHRGLIGFVHTQRRHRDAVRDASSWAEMAQALEAWFASHCGTVQWRLANWKGASRWQHEAAEQTDALFVMLGQLDTFGLARSPRAAARLIAAFLDGDVVTAESRGAGVLVDQIVGASGAVFDHAFVLGANEGLLPGRVADDLVLTSAHGPEPLGVLTGPSNRPARDRRGMLAALDGASSSVTVTYARWDIRSGGAMYPSVLVPNHTGAVNEHVASHAAQVLDPGAPWLHSDEWFSREPARTEPRLSRRRRSITARLQPHATEFDGQVGRLGDLDPHSRTSAEGVRAQVGITSLEEWVDCGAKYFVTRVLGARTDDTDPSDIVDIEPREKGTLLHRVFERLIAEWIEANAAPTIGWIASSADIDATMVRAEQVLDEEAQPLLAKHHLGHPTMWRARRAQILGALRRGLEPELSDGAMPVAVEFGFGARFDRPSVVWQSPFDPSVDIHFSGSIDRLDRMPGGALRVMDLKSGSRGNFTSIKPEQPFGADGNKLQLAFYGWAAAQDRGERVSESAYRFVGRHDSNADVNLPLTDEVEHGLHDIIDSIAAGIRSGQFNPGEVGQFGCEVCSPDMLGGAEINQRLLEWAALVTDVEVQSKVQPDVQPEVQPGAEA